MRAVFRDERDSVPRGSGLTGVFQHQQFHQYHHDNNNSHNQNHQHHFQDRDGDATVGNGQLHTPPHEHDFAFPDQDGYGLAGDANRVVAWLEIWDYVGGAGFRGFLAEDHEAETSAFVFFDSAVVGRDLKQALIAIMELADGPLRCSKVVIAIDRTIPEREAKTLMKGLQWAGFSLATLDHWAGGVRDVTSNRWLFMAYED